MWPSRCQHLPRGPGFTPVGTTEGHQIFVDVLTRFAERSRNPRLTPIIARIALPPSVAVLGRDGVGRGTVGAALTRAGGTNPRARGRVTLTPDPKAADVHVLVIAEALKPEDRVDLANADRPIVTVLNKADLTGRSDGGPLTRAHRRAADCRALTGVPTVPMVALLAAADLNEELMSALRVLVTEPELRRRLLAALDRFGIASAVLALGEGADAATVSTVLRRASQVDRVVEHIEAAAAPVCYRRVRSAITELYSLAVQSGDRRLADFLSTDETVLGVMAAAVGVVEAAGVAVDRGDDAAAHLRRAVHWRRYSRGPVDALHRSCGADIARGSLRLLGRAR